MNTNKCLKCHWPWKSSFNNKLSLAQKLYDFFLCVENEFIVILIMSDTFCKAQLNYFEVTSFLKYVCNFIFFCMKYCKNVDPGNWQFFEEKHFTCHGYKKVFWTYDTRLIFHIENKKTSKHFIKSEFAADMFYYFSKLFPQTWLVMVFRIPSRNLTLSIKIPLYGVYWNDLSKSSYLSKVLKCRAYGGHQRVYLNLSVLFISHSSPDPVSFFCCLFHTRHTFD